ncbi:MAG: MmoB/DmpM family protein [Gammaproteobacteria bacterium]|nr:MmoB/DmpM family protein [Gammaproteobacteria bacterium]
MSIHDSNRLSVSLILMQGSAEAQATLDLLEREDPELVIDDHETFWKITSTTGHIEVNMERVSEELGVEISLSQWLVILSSYVGRVHTEPGKFTLTSDVTEIHRT